MEDKTVTYAIFGVIAIVVMAGFAVLMTSETTGMGVRATYGYAGLPKIYGGALRGADFPYSAGRTVRGGVTERPGYDYPVEVATTQEAYANLAYDIYGARDPTRIYSVMKSCDGQARLGEVPRNYVIDMPGSRAQNIFGQALSDYCVPAPQFDGNYCCRSDGSW
jgi:hypothetical protein